MIAEAMFDPFMDFVFMRRALAAAFALSLGGAPLGVFMMLRRVTLVGDALAHAILPGIAAAFLAAGFSLWAMTLGGMTAALAVGLATVYLARRTTLKEDGVLTLLYLLSLAAGVAMLSLNGGRVSLSHFLFGNILAIDGASLSLIVGASSLTLFGVAGFFRRLVIEGFDPDFLGVAEGRTRWLGSLVFFTLLTVCLVEAFQAVGTLMALGLILLPALAARFWGRSLDGILALAIVFAVFASFAGLLISFHAGLPSGPAIVLVLGFLGLFSALFGRYGSVRSKD